MNERKPDWLRVKVPTGPVVRKVSDILKRRNLHTVCDSAKCPNKGECWGCGTATFMILGDVCTRNCRFCAVPTGKEGTPVNPREPFELADAVRELELTYAVITSVDRDDLQDRGASHFASCVREIKKAVPGILVEVLIPDYDAGEMPILAESCPDTIAHNIETIPRLQSVRDSRANYTKSLETLRIAASTTKSFVKSSILLGLGETIDEVSASMDDLLSVGCTSLVMGQYLRPTPMQLEVVEYITPEKFEKYADIARSKGFKAVVSSPLARTSYHAKESYGRRG